MPGCSAKTGVVACAALLLAATASPCETARPDAGDSAAVQSCVKSAPDRPQRERCIGIVADPCADRPDAQSTADQVACVARESAVWDDILNETYRRLRDKLDAAQKIKLRKMQRGLQRCQHRLHCIDENTPQNVLLTAQSSRHISRAHLRHWMSSTIDSAQVASEREQDPHAQ